MGAGQEHPHRHRAVHEAGHTIAALDLRLPFVSVSIEEEERKEADGPTYGSTKVRPLSDCFPKKEIEERSRRVVEDVKKRVIELLAAEAATKLIMKREKDSLAEKDMSDIAHARLAFPELDDELVQTLREAAREVVARRQTDIEKLADALVKQMSLNVDDVRLLLEA